MNEMANDLTTAELDRKALEALVVDNPDLERLEALQNEIQPSTSR